MHYDNICTNTIAIQFVDGSTIHFTPLGYFDIGETKTDVEFMEVKIEKRTTDTLLIVNDQKKVEKLNLYKFSSQKVHNLSDFCVKLAIKHTVIYKKYSNCVLWKKG